MPPLNKKNQSGSAEPAKSESKDNAGSQGVESNADGSVKGANDPPPPPPIDATQSDEDLLLQFNLEALERGYTEEGAASIAAGRLRHLRSGGDGYSVLDEQSDDLKKQQDLAAAPPPPPAPAPESAAGLVPLKPQDGVTGATHDGEQYTVGEDGLMHDHERHAVHFLGLGFRLPEG
jgi:hypothetical protein